MSMSLLGGFCLCVERAPAGSTVSRKNRGKILEPVSGRSPRARQTGPMAGKRSAGLLLFRTSEAGVEVLLGHMGGPFWAKKDAAAWSLPKGELDPDETPELAARR